MNGGALRSRGDTALTLAFRFDGTCAFKSIYTLHLHTLNGHFELDKENDNIW